MERKNAKQLRLEDGAGITAEKFHRRYQVATNQHNLSFVDFGNLVFARGLDEIQKYLQEDTKKKNTPRKIRKRKP